MVIRVHENGNNVNQHLSNDNIERQEHKECNSVTIESDHVLESFLRQNDSLFINDKSTQENNATS